MAEEIMERLEQLLIAQEGVAAREQLLARGMSSSAVKRRLQSGAWRRLAPGVYATFTGALTRSAELWAAVLAAGPDAALSHETAAELHGFAREAADRIHVTVPAERHRARGSGGGYRPGTVLHRSRILVAEQPAPWVLPRTTAEATVLDLIQASATFDDAYGWICRATARRIVSRMMVREALAGRGRIKWRSWVADALADLDGGAESPLERRYARDMERAHGLPAAERQARRQAGAGQIRVDALYRQYQLCVELDGAAYHLPEDRRRDADRDNALIAGDGIVTLRFGWVSVTEKCCQSAGIVAAALARHGWAGSVRRCGPSCTIERDISRIVGVRVRKPGPPRPR